MGFFVGALPYDRADGNRKQPGSRRSSATALGLTTPATATTMALEYRAALPDDVAECLDVRGRTRENAISAEGLRAKGITLQSWAEDVRQGALPGHVCLADGKIIGFCFGVRESGEVGVLALLPAFENQGIGRSLLNRVVQELKTFGFNRLFLGCSPDASTRSYGFYRHLGWRSTGTFDVAGMRSLNTSSRSTSRRVLVPESRKAALSR
jgi:GNAT superfamily N-acetyltransferase